MPGPTAAAVTVSRNGADLPTAAHVEANRAAHRDFRDRLEKGACMTSHAGVLGSVLNGANLARQFWSALLMPSTVLRLKANLSP